MHVARAATSLVAHGTPLGSSGLEEGDITFTSLEPESLLLIVAGFIEEVGKNDDVADDTVDDTCDAAVGAIVGAAVGANVRESDEATTDAASLPQLLSPGGVCDVWDITSVAGECAEDNANVEDAGVERGGERKPTSPPVTSLLSTPPDTVGDAERRRDGDGATCNNDGNADADNDDEKASAAEEKEVEEEVDVSKIGSSLLRERPTALLPVLVLLEVAPFRDDAAPYSDEVVPSTANDGDGALLSQRLHVTGHSLP